MRTAIPQVFPNIQLQLCIFHINGNVVLSINKWWKKSNDPATDNDRDNEDADDIQEMERGNTKVRDMKDVKLGPLPK